MTFRGAGISRFGLAALTALCGNAWAQSTVSIYGIIDTGIEYQHVSAGATRHSATNSTQLVPGSFSAPRLGFRGNEDLGGGLQAFFNLETGFTSDDGALVGPIFNRRSVVGMSDKRFGELWFGRDYSPAFWVQLYTDINAFSLYGNSTTMAQWSINNMLRTSNGIFYATPEYKGFKGRLTYSLGDEKLTPRDAGVLKGASVEYRSGALSAGAWVQSRSVEFPANSGMSASTVYKGVTALYRFGSWAVDAGYSRFSPAGPQTASNGVVSGVWSGVAYQFGVSEVRFNLGRVTTDLAGPTDAKSIVMGLNYTYALSKRTNLYAGIGRIDNNSVAQVALEASTRPIAASNGPGSDPSAFAFGMRHTF